MQSYLKTADNQFESKTNHSTDTPIYLLQEKLSVTIILGPRAAYALLICAVLLTVNYLRLFLKLRDTQTQLYLNGILNYRFRTQKFFVSWRLSRSVFAPLMD